MKLLRYRITCIDILVLLSESVVGESAPESLGVNNTGDALGHLQHSFTLGHFTSLDGLKDVCGVFVDERNAGNTIGRTELLDRLDALEDSSDIRDLGVRRKRHDHFTGNVLHRDPREHLI